jgi:hypothetical protein
MYRILMCAAAGAAIVVMPAKADETLKWRHVHHAASNQSLEVGDVNAMPRPSALAGDRVFP